MAGMAGLTFGGVGSPSRILCLGAHCDDVEIGCGATLSELSARNPAVQIRTVVFCSTKTREAEMNACMSNLIASGVEVQSYFGGFRDGYLPYEGPTRAKEYAASSADGFSPDLVLTHSRNDSHQDHRFVAEITYQVYRDSLILEMEIPKYDGDLGRCNVYIPVGIEAVERKVTALLASYVSQNNKHWFTEETFKALMRLRGIECRSESGFAEGFNSSKITIT